MYVNKSHRAVMLWLIMCAALVASMVLVGGYTRLSGSGMSITEWKPIHGTIPPQGDVQWQEEFEKYQKIPQYQLINKGMTLAEFKHIFWPEFWHRILGRLVGIVLLVPLIIFATTSTITKRFSLRMLGISALVGAQGFMGWYMVSSGLSENTHVSHLRLAAHLSLALLVFATILWAILDVIQNKPAQATCNKKLITYCGWFFLLCMQIIYGALMAGLHAGLLYNTYPDMDGMWLPPELLAQFPWWSNLFENHTAVQFIHRTLAVLLIFGFSSWWFFNQKWVTTERLNRLCISVAGVIAVQFTLGVLTLINAVPLHLALTHQMVALVLFGVSVVLLYKVKKSCR